MPVLLVAHRAAEVASDLECACAVADMVEIDVHLFRGRLEVRHAKVLWPFATRWDRWYLVPREAARPSLDDVLQVVDPDAHLWLDLKGFSSRLTRKVVLAIADRPLTTVSSRSWWILPPEGRHRNLRVVHSVGSRFQLWVVGRRRSNSLESVAIDRRLVGADSISELRRVARSLFVWGIHDVEQGLQAVQAGADGLIVDGIDTIARIRERFVSSGDVRASQAGRTIRATRSFL